MEGLVVVLLKITAQLEALELLVKDTLAVMWETHTKVLAGEGLVLLEL
jgi:hypothetical protein